jgi:hypothetical protein
MAANAEKQVKINQHGVTAPVRPTRSTASGRFTTIRKAQSERLISKHQKAFKLLAKR